MLPPPDPGARPPGLSASAGLAVFLVTFAVYAALVPWLVRVWPRTGDEPHYVLAAHSLVFDGDLDLSNNYAQGDFSSFYGEATLTPHTRPGRGGQAALTHNLGLSLLIAPAYALGGYPAVMYFLAGLGALLGAQVFLIGYHLTRNTLAAGLGWLAVSFTPPVLWYVFLIYPEMIAGICVAAVVQLLLLERRSEVRGPRSGVAAAALALLPWLSSRYLPVWGLLVAAAGWRALAGRSRSWLLAAVGGLAGLGTYTLFSLWLYGSASPSAAYAGPTPLGIEQSFALARFARGLLGWLLDNQRGLLITAPVYIAALWGGFRLLRREPVAGTAVLAPFGVTLVTVAAWGGFWIGWEHSARFLVFALPPLGAGLAWLAAAGRRAVVLPIMGLLLALSALNGWAVIQKPLDGILSSPVAALKPVLDLEGLVPSMAAYVFVPPGAEAVVGAPGDPGWWTVPKGQSGIALRKVDVAGFPFGWYRGRLPIRAAGAAADTPLARVKIFSPRGGDYASHLVLPGDLSPDGAFEFSFASPLYDGWAFPPTILISATGQADLALGTLVIEPDPLRSLLLPAAWLATLALAGLWVTAGAKVPRPFWMPFPPALNLLLGAAALASVVWSLQPQARHLAAADLVRTVGVIVSDSAAYRNRAVEANPDAGHEAGVLAASLPEIYGPGRYRVTLSLQRLGEASEAGQPAAALSVLDAKSALLAPPWEIPARALPGGEYQTLQFDFDNPRQQALRISLSYSGRAGLRADQITVEPVR